ncbi:MAG: alpha/beta hydrolase [Deltaproteobacteria bacterium]|nr:alpha/beta hydrolase [Deltaproteobacteria bacterium]
MAGDGQPLVLLYGGLMDRRMWDDPFESFAERIREAKQIVIPGAGHHVNMEKPEVFNRVVMEFLGSVEECISS